MSPIEARDPLATLPTSKSVLYVQISFSEYALKHLNVAGFCTAVLREGLTENINKFGGIFHGGRGGVYPFHQIINFEQAS